MAKGSTVFFKLPIEEMRGKLATKQDGIMYAGQEKGENTLSIGDGNHAATNFEKYIVVTKSRGKNRFYVKSNTTVANSTGTLNTRAILALAIPLVDAIYARRDDAIEMLPFKESYQVFQKGETLREYLTRVVVESIRRGKNNIEYYSKPNQQGLSEYVTLIANPYVAFNTVAPTIFAGGRQFGAQGKEAKIIQEYLKYRALQMNARKCIIRLHDTKTGSTYQFAFVAEETTTFGNLIGSTGSERTLQALVYGMTSSGQQVREIKLYPFKLDYAVAGVPFMDAAKTVALDPHTVISETTDLYI